MITGNKIATILVVAWIGFLVWAGTTGKFNSPKPKPDPCEQVTDKASPIHIGLRVLPGTSEQQFIRCYRKHEKFMKAVRRMELEESYKWVSDREKVNQIVDKEMEKYGPPTTSEDELIRLSKMTQEERDREACQRLFNGKYLNWNDVEHGLSNPNQADKQSLKFYRETYAFCRRFR